MKYNINKKIYFFLFFLIAAAMPIYSDPTVLRATIDIGSGATKLRVAEVNLREHKIVKILETKNFAVPYQEQLARSSTGAFDEAVMKTGLQAIEESAQIAKKFNVEKVIAVATASFRNAKNASDFIDRIYEKTGVRVYIIDQNLEGELAFQAAISELGVPAKNLVVWDIGGGSLQLTAKDRRGNFQIYRGKIASVPFKNYVIEHIENKNPSEVSTPNPMNFEEIIRADIYARDVASRVDRVFQRKIHDPQTVVVGVGNIFGLQLYEMVGKKNVLTRDEMIHAVATLANKTDQEVGGGPFANVYVTNSIFVLGFMNSFDINKMQIADINPADGAFFHSRFWREHLQSDEQHCTNEQHCAHQEK